MLCCDVLCWGAPAQCQCAVLECCARLGCCAVLGCARLGCYAVLGCARLGCTSPVLGCRPVYTAGHKLCIIQYCTYEHPSMCFTLVGVIVLRSCGFGRRVAQQATGPYGCLVCPQYPASCVFILLVHPLAHRMLHLVYLHRLFVLYGCCSSLHFVILYNTQCDGAEIQNAKRMGN